jgi:hypothetical protein
MISFSAKFDTFPTIGFHDYRFCMTVEHYSCWEAGNQYCEPDFVHFDCRQQVHLQPLRHKKWDILTWFNMVLQNTLKQSLIGKRLNSLMALKKVCKDLDINKLL